MGIVILVFAVIIALLWVSAIILMIYSSLQPSNVFSTASINISSDSENVIVYVPVMLDWNGEIMEMYEAPNITGNLAVSIIDSEYGKALKVSGTSGQINMKEGRGGRPGKNYAASNYSISMSTIQNELGLIYDLNHNTIATAIRENKKRWKFYINAWVYSEHEVDDFTFSFERFDGGQSLDLNMLNGTQKLVPGWQQINLEPKVIFEDY